MKFYRNTVLTALLSLFAVALGVHGLFEGQEILHKYRHVYDTCTTGVVKANNNSNHGRYATTIVTWYDGQGNEHITYSLIGLGMGSREGEQYTVRYDSRNPKDAIIDTTYQKYGKIINGALSVLIGFIIAIKAVYSKEKGKESNNLNLENNKESNEYQ